MVGAIHTNTIEGFWRQLKRSIVGSYHKVSEKYLSLYMAEAQFRYNTRNNSEIFGYVKYIIARDAAPDYVLVLFLYV